MLPASHNPRDSRGTGQPIRIGGTVLCAQRHICAFFKCRGTKEQGFPRIRFVTHMAWALEDRPGVDGLLKYEASANLIGGILQENPFFAPPEEFLRELHERRERGQAAASAQAR